MSMTTVAPARARSQWTTVEGRRIHARSWGPPPDVGGPPVVLVHGLVVSGAFYGPAGERLAGRFSLHAPDQPGFGLSEGPDWALTVPELAAATIRWIEAEGFERVHLVGVSFGCQVAAEIAMRRPGIVDHMVVASLTMDPTARDLLPQLRRWRHEAATHSKELRRLLLRDYARAGIRRAVATIRHALADRIEEKLPFVPAPSLVLRGTADPLVPEAWAREAAGLLPQGELEIVPDAPHAMNFDAPDAFAAAVRRFLAES